MVKTKKNYSSFQKLIKCGKKCSKSKDKTKCINENCSKHIKVFDNLIKKYHNEKYKKLNNSNKSLKKCYKKHCSQHSNKIKKKQCIKKKCTKELKKITSIIM